MGCTTSKPPPPHAPMVVKEHDEPMRFPEGKSPVIKVFGEAEGMTQVHALREIPASAVKVGVASANSSVGIATLKALLLKKPATVTADASAPQLWVVAVVRSMEAARKVMEALGPDCVDYEIRIGGDFAKPEVFLKTMEGLSKVFLVAPQGPHKGEFVAEGARMAKKAGVAHIVLLSVMGAQYRAITFARLFRDAEEVVEALGVPFTVLRAGPFADTYFSPAMIASKSSFLSATGEGKFTLVSVADVGACGAVVLSSNSDTHFGKYYELTGSAAVTGAEIAAIATKVFNKPVVEDKFTPHEMNLALQGWGVDAWQAVVMEELYNLLGQSMAAGVSTDVKTLTGSHASIEDYLLANFEACGGVRAAPPPQSVPAPQTAESAPPMVSPVA